MSAEEAGSIGHGPGATRSKQVFGAPERLNNRPRDTETDLRKAAVQFEAVFVRQMLAAMRATVPESGLIDGGQAEDLFAGMLDGHLADVMASRTGSGLADAIYRQLIRGV